MSRDLGQMYSIGEAAGGRYIQCHKCGKRSFDVSDINQGYCANCHTFHRGCVTSYRIYHNPADFPGKYVVRPFRIAAGSASPQDILGAVDSLEAARSLVPDGFYRMDRQSSDEPQVVENWI